MKNIPLLIFFLFAINGCTEQSALQPITPEPDGIFRAMPALDDMVMYEVNLRAFSESGTIAGLIQRLDSIKALGVNALWIMPIYPVGIVKGINSPYCIRDYKAVADEYGTISDFKRLIDSAHAKGMAVLLDWVANHTAWDHTWIANKGWYTTNASGSIVQPPGTNWTDVADLNYNSQPMRDSMIAAMQWWVETYNIDGFRCDYADGVPADFWKKAISRLDSLPNRNLVFLAEGTRGDHFASGFDLIFSWNYYSTLKSVFSGTNASSLITTHTQEYANIPTGKHRLRFTTNHDESAWDNSPVVLFKSIEGALAASVITVFMEGVPLFYSGQEVGRSSKTPFFSKSPIQWNDNPAIFSAYKQCMKVYSNNTAARKGINNFYPLTNVICFTKSYQEQQMLVMVNVRNQQSMISLPTDLQGSSWVDAINGTPVQLQTLLYLQPYQYRILIKK